MTIRTLLDSREPLDAGLLGYDGTRDPGHDSEGLIVIYQPPTANSPGEVMIQNPDSVTVLIGPEIHHVAEALFTAVRLGIRTLRNPQQDLPL